MDYCSFGSSLSLFSGGGAFCGFGLAAVLVAARFPDVRMAEWLDAPQALSPDARFCQASQPVWPPVPSRP